MARALAAGLAIAALIASTSLAAEGPDETAALAAKLTSKDLAVRIAAAQALARRSPDIGPAIPALAEALADEYWDVRQGASEALRKAGAAAVPALVRLIGRDHYYHRFYATRILGHIGPEARTAVPHLGKALADPALDVRCESARALAAIGDARPVAKPLAAALTDPYEGVRAAAVEALGSTGTEALDPLIVLLDHPDGSVARSAAAAVCRIGPDAAPAAPELAALLDREFEAAERAYGQLQEGIYNSRIGHAIADSPVVDALAAVGPAAVGPLRERLRRGNPRYNRWLASALGRLGPGAADAVPDLLDWLRRTKDPWPQAWTALAIGAIHAHADHAIPALMDLVRLGQDTPSRHAAMALGRFGPAALGPLAEALSDPEPMVRRAAAIGLAQMGPEAKPAAAALRRLAKDADPAVAAEAARALQAIRGE